MILIIIVATETEESIKVLYPIQKDRKILFVNEISILRKLYKKFEDCSVENGVVKLITGGQGTWSMIWSHKDDAKIAVRCIVVVYTYGEPLFPILKQCVQDNDRKMLFWFFSRMVSPKTNVFNARIDF